MAIVVKGIGIVGFGGDEESTSGEEALLLGVASGDSSGFAVLEYGKETLFEDSVS